MVWRSPCASSPPFRKPSPISALPPHAYKLVAWLVKMTQAQDWEAGSRPIAWPCAARQAEFLGLTRNAVKTLNRMLFEAGIVVMRDSPTGKRYGRRDDQGRIVEAYGFDLSPLAFRYDEFIRTAAEARAERERCGHFRRRATCARRAIAQIGETLAAAGPLPSSWPQLATETAESVAAIRKARTSDDFALIAQDLESRKAQAEVWATEASKAGNPDPVGPADRPHTISTNSSLDPSDTVIASDEGSWGKKTSQIPEAGHQAGKDRGEKIAARDFERPVKVHPGELLQLAPRLADYVAQTYPDWKDIVNGAADGLRHDLGVSQSLWGEACLAVGRPLAAVALAIVSTKPREHFTRGAGGYFAAMIKRAKTGELHLDRTLWKLRRDRIEREGRATWH